MITTLEIVLDFLSRAGLLGTGGIVAVSGGPDSVYLASLMRRLNAGLVITKLTLAHLNHQLRGAESDADEAFVVALAKEWGLNCRTTRVDVARAARQSGDNLEQRARALRYDWLVQIAREEGAAWVATGHSADDQAETVLFRLLRGSGLQGLSGMAPCRELAPGIDLIRPLLDVRRSDILAILGEKGQAFREDSSNQDLRLTRNRLRHELMPMLAREYNSALAETLCRLAIQARQAQAEVDRCAARLLAEAELPRAGAMVVLAVAPMHTASRHLRREVFRLIWRREGWPAGQMSFEAWDRLADLIEADSGAQDMPGGVRVQRVGIVVQAFGMDANIRNAESSETAEAKT